uniref:Spermatosis associated 33 n=1 Tax=Panthera tigris altaica TaxID=74533 RepID=A0A8C9J703_PANTA
MGLSKSEEQKGRVYSVPKARERPTGRHSQESEKPPDAKPAESLHGKRGAAKRHPEPDAGLELTECEIKPDVKVNSSKKKAVIPQIIITKASQETLTSYGSIGSEEQRTIQEQAEWGPYYRHRNPSTVDAYGLRK